MSTDGRDGRTSERIVDATLELAEERGWGDVRLHQVAERLDLPLGQIGARFRDLDAVANAWFGRARAALLALDPGEIAGRPAPERLEIALMRWLDTLAPHRRLTGEILRGKLQPGHAHHWAPLIFDLSRLVHWVLDAARIESTGRRRQLAEIGLTLIVLATLRDWLDDPEPGQARTRSRLARRLAIADRALGRRGAG